jgi:membrane protease YdiL (CAAX protease family)
VAGTAEEFVYRGVMTELAQRLIGIALVTIVALSISFAAAHAVQGLRSMFGIFVIALACHALVWLAQSLIPVMVVHFAYDLTATSDSAMVRGERHRTARRRVTPRGAIL